MRRRLATTLGTALLATMLLAPAAQAKNTPNPFFTEGLPGCKGNFNATLNHWSGEDESEFGTLNPTAKDSKGGGYFFRNGQEFKAAREGFQAAICG